MTVGVIDDLMTELARLPGIGRKTAQRLTYHLLLRPPEQAAQLAAALRGVADRVRPCGSCGNPTETDPCAICADPRREEALLCVVEEASAIPVLDRAGFRGRYLVLGGRLSPLDGVGPDSLRIGLLQDRMRAGTVREVILATNPSLDGEATATYLHQILAASGVRVSRLARGLPVGGDLEYVDGVTLTLALQDRQEVG